MMRRTTFAATPIRADNGQPAIAVVAMPAEAAHPLSFLITPEAAYEFARELPKVADDAVARYGRVATHEAEPGSPEDLAHWPPSDLDPG